MLVVDITPTEGLNCVRLWPKLKWSVCEAVMNEVLMLGFDLESGKGKFGDTWLGAGEEEEEEVKRRWRGHLLTAREK